MASFTVIHAKDFFISCSLRVSIGWKGRRGLRPALRLVRELRHPLGGCYEFLAVCRLENSGLGHDLLEGEASGHSEPSFPALVPVRPAGVVDAVRVEDGEELVDADLRLVVEALASERLSEPVPAGALGALAVGLVALCVLFLVRAADDAVGL